MNDVPAYFETLLTVFAFLDTGAYLAGALVCLAYRRASRFLLVVSVGFAVGFLVSAIGLYRATTWQFYPESLFPTYLYLLILNFLSSLSKVAVVLGLGGALFDIRRKLALGKERDHDLA